MPFVFLIKDVQGASADPLSLVEDHYFDSGGTDVNTISFTPSGNEQAEDWVLAFIGINSDDDMATVPSGFALVDPPGSLDNGANRFKLYRKKLTAAVGGTLTWGLPTTPLLIESEAKAYFAIIRAADGTTPFPSIGSFNEFSSSTGGQLQSLMVGRTNSWFIHGMIHDTGGWPADQVTAQWPSGTAVADRKVEDSGEEFSLAMYMAIQEVSADTGTRQWSFGGTDTERNQGIGIIVQPADGASGGGSSDPNPPSQIIEIPGANKLEAGTTGNNTASGGELTSTINQVAASPDGITVAGQRPAYTLLRQNGKHGWVFSGGTDHVKLDAAMTVESQTLFVPVCLKPIGLDTAWDSDYPRVWAVGDKIYLTLIKGSTNTSHKLEFYRRYSTSDARWQTVNDVLFDGQATVVAVDWDDSQPAGNLTIYKDGVALQLTRLSPGSGAPHSTAGLAFHVGNRQHDESQTFFLNRGFYGDVYEFDPIIGPVSLGDKKTAIDEIGASWGITQANPFLPSIENQDFNVLTGAAVGTVVGQVVAQTPIGSTLTYALSGAAETGPYAIQANDGKIVTDGAVPVVDTVTSGTVTVANSVGDDTADVNITVVETLPSAALEWPRNDNASWINSAATFTLPATGDVDLSPGDTVDNGVTLTGSTDLVVFGHPTQTRVADLTRVTGINRVAFIGGDFTAHSYEPDLAGGTWDRLIGAFDIKQQIWVEGIRANPGYAQDFFQGDGGHGSGAYEPDIFGQNLYLHGLDSVQNKGHADGFQPLGWVDQFNLANVYIESGYQCLFLLNQYPGGDNKRIRRIKLRHIDLEQLNLNQNIGHKFSYLISTERADNSAYTEPTELTDVWGCIKDGQTPPTGSGYRHHFWSWTQTGSSPKQGRMTLLGGAAGDGYINLINAKPARPGGRILIDNNNGTFRAPGSGTVLGGIGYS